MVRQGTTTSNFGAGKRESHDASVFYARFASPGLSDDATVLPIREITEPVVVGDARQMKELADGEVALVVTSPPYFAGKQYEEELEREGVPSSYAEYLQLLAEVFAECRRVLEPGGRIAVNVANLGRKPYRSLASDVVEILQGQGLLMRGEVVWRKGEGASGSCAWGSYASAANPVLRDLTERVVIASKGRFDRALSSKDRRARGLPWRSTMTADEFMEATLDVWDLPPESAKRVNHPAPFPVVLPERLIGMYTYEEDLVLDPFVGSGSTLVAAARTNRRHIGYDLDPTYAQICRARLSAEGHLALDMPDERDTATMARRAERVLIEAGFVISRRKIRKARVGHVYAFAVQDTHGAEWLVDVVGAMTLGRAGLDRTETAWATAGRVAMAAQQGVERLLIMTPNAPRPTSASGKVLSALRSVAPKHFAIVDLARPTRAAAQLQLLASSGSA